MTAPAAILFERFDLRRIAPQPWKNGAGLTREVAAGGAANGLFDWRISVAEVDRDAPFSHLPGIARCIVLLRGAGLHLRAGDGSLDHRLDTPHVPFHFSGDVALQARLLGGPCSDLNVMVRRGDWRSEVTSHHAPAELRGAAVSLVLACAGDWLIGAGGATPIGPFEALLWRAPTPPISVRPVGPAGAASLLHVRLCHDHASRDEQGAP